MKQLIKQILFPNGRQLRRLRGGLAKGMLMELDLLDQSQRYWGLDERELLASFQQLIPTCRSLIDIGANDGFYTMAFLKSSAEYVISCEPSSAVERLLYNAKANGYEPGDRFRIECRPIGLDTGFLQVADLIQNLPHPILLKVDIDGGEFELLQSAEACPFLSRLHWIVETHSKDIEDRCVEWFEVRGYQTQIIVNAPWRIFLPERRPIYHNRWLIAKPK